MRNNFNISCLDINAEGDVWLGNNQKGIALWAQRNWYFFDKAYGFQANTVTKGIFYDEANAKLALAIKDTLRVYEILGPRKISTAYKSIPLFGIQKLNRLNEVSAIVKTNRGIYLYQNQKLGLLRLDFVKDEIIDVDEITTNRWAITTPNKVYEVAFRNSELVLIRSFPLIIVIILPHQLLGIINYTLPQKERVYLCIILIRKLRFYMIQPMV